MQERWVPSLGWEDAPEEGLATAPVLLPGDSLGQRSLAGYGPLGRKGSDTTERLTTRTRTPVKEKTLQSFSTPPSSHSASASTSPGLLHLLPKRTDLTPPRTRVEHRPPRLRLLALFHHAVTTTRLLTAAPSQEWSCQGPAASSSPASQPVRAPEAPTRCAGPVAKQVSPS